MTISPTSSARESKYPSFSHLRFLSDGVWCSLTAEIENITSGRVTAQHQCTWQHPRGPGIPGTWEHSVTSVPGKGWFWQPLRIAKPTVIGLVLIKSILPCSIPTAGENIFHFHTNFIRFSTQKTNHFLRNEMKRKAKPFSPFSGGELENCTRVGRKKYDKG